MAFAVSHLDRLKKIQQNYYIQNVTSSVFCLLTEWKTEIVGYPQVCRTYTRKYTQKDTYKESQALNIKFTPLTSRAHTSLLLATPAAIEHWLTSRRMRLFGTSAYYESHQIYWTCDWGKDMLQTLKRNQKQDGWAWCSLLFRRSFNDPVSNVHATIWRVFVLYQFI
jgi:hypothetical protein